MTCVRRLQAERTPHAGMYKQPTALTAGENLWAHKKACLRELARAQLRLDAGHQLVAAERLGHVVVGAGLCTGRGAIAQASLAKEMLQRQQERACRHKAAQLAGGHAGSHAKARFLHLFSRLPPVACPSRLSAANRAQPNLAATSSSCTHKWHTQVEAEPIVCTVNLPAGLPPRAPPGCWLRPG